MLINKIIFIHGNDTLKWDYLWVPWLKEQLKQFNIELIFETMPDSIIARKKYWIPFLKDRIGTDEKTLLIGHSSGAVCAMRYAENNKIFGSILISPCYTDLGLESEKVSGWYDDEWQWNKIKENQKVIGLFYSKNDKWIPLNEFIYIKDKLNLKDVYEFNNNGHFTEQDTFPEIVKYVRKIINRN